MPERWLERAILVGAALMVALTGHHQAPVWRASTLKKSSKHPPAQTSPPTTRSGLARGTPSIPKVHLDVAVIEGTRPRTCSRHQDTWRDRHCPEAGESSPGIGPAFSTPRRTKAGDRIELASDGKVYSCMESFRVLHLHSIGAGAGRAYPDPDHLLPLSLRGAGMKRYVVIARLDQRRSRRPCEIG
jgi:hypothetical protein